VTSAGSGAFTPADANMQDIADQAGAIRSPSRRAAFVARYQWSSTEKEAWLTQLETSVESAWSGRHQFHINRPQWEWIGARVNVDVIAHDGTRGANDHLAITSVKMPAGENFYGHNDAGLVDPSGDVNHGFSSTDPGSATDPYDSTMTLASTDVTNRPDNTLSNFVTFAHNSDVLDASVQTGLQDWIATFQGAPTAPGAPATGSRSIALKLTAHTSASGTADYNRDLAQRRADAVQTFLTTHGFTNVTGSIVTDPAGVETGATTSDSAARQQRQRRVDLTVDSGVSQVLAAHEFGHAFGLGDEYATSPAAGTAGTSFIDGTGAQAGTAASHDSLTKNMTDASGNHLPGAVHENNDNIMSFGNTVQPQHYSTFHAALVEITSVSEWALGAATTRPTAPGGSSTPAPAPGTTPATPPPTP
jgi:outer membrane protein OmpA-like peptidoglycan-associated protein